jgi:choline dehydrogenase
MTQIDEEVTEYIVVGSGAGGGTVAARLAENGATVTLLEAGRDPKQVGADGLPEDYEVPGFHVKASENPEFSWDFFVRHYEDDNAQSLDPKCCFEQTPEGPKLKGIFYPRAGALGGCTAHNAMILVYPHNGDWDGIAHLTGDASWRSENMRRYFERLENCRYRKLDKVIRRIWNPTRHGFDGWLHAEKPLPIKQLLRDRALVRVLVRSVVAALAHERSPFRALGNFLFSLGDPNDWRLVVAQAEGQRFAPLTTIGHQRMGTRERLLEVQQKFPERLRIITDALATRVTFDETNRAIGVEYLAGEKVYRAFQNPSSRAGELRERRCTREVILAGGAFNTPQLLMLSGIGPSAHLSQFGIKHLVDLPGVGKNLQDRYEVCVVNRMCKDWEVLKNAKFARGDPQLRQWASGQGVYTTNGAILAIIRKAFKQRALPDLFIFALLSSFKGYYSDYSKECCSRHDYLSWAILKAHTLNRAGEVRLRSSDPRDMPEVTFRYFQEGDDVDDEDLKSVISGIRFVRQMTESLYQSGFIAEEELPGRYVATDKDLSDFVKNNAWGHHASCTCPIGPRSAGGVLDSAFRVHGTKGLRVVDASIFPKIPGFFIVSAIYMIAEKAADVILRDKVIYGKRYL